ncbi:MAG: class II aldolase/adducin family protein [Methanobacteriaceae archaeon]|jgi:L-fuculose-phosphate aldolase|uniref:class II aldolase/adducin family protein n=1 Tax=Methanobrevibacter TaxID=2172 RepID=UPI00375FA7E7|nr:class II aldolase/adducin family protein [Methanobacteriaceae archaeon]MDD4593662.1 class II aldolase/adducin family protein [Methanobacteriaceae archaeon]
MQKEINSIINISNKLFNRHLVTGKAGNVSVKFKNNGKIIIGITPTLKSLNNLKFNDIVLVDLEGNIISKGKPSSEVFMHLNIYKSNKNVNAIVHTHSPFATGFSFSDKKIKRLEGFGKIEKPYLAEVNYEIPGTMDLANKVGEAIKNEDVLILKNHGVISVGENLEEAFSLADFVEEIAKTQFITHTLNLIK